MKLKLKEDPKEWRKATWLSALGLAILSSVLRWRHVLPKPGWLAVLSLLAVIAITAWARPVVFRGYYRASSRLGFLISQCIGHVLLMLMFLLVLTPLGLIMRLGGKDLLRLKRIRNGDTYWNPARETGPLDRMF